MGFHRKRLISFIMNNTCNCRCVYCPYFGRGGLFSNAPAQRLSLAFAECGLRDFFATHPERAIRFMGIGEPTLDFDEIAAITALARGLAGGPIFVELQTNGEFSPRVARWLASNASLVWVSMDGVRDVQDAYRPRRDGRSSFEVVDRNLRLLAAGACTVGLRATVGVRNLHRQRELVDYALSHGIRAIDVEPLGPFEACAQEAPDPDAFIHTFSEALVYAEARGVHYTTWGLINFDEEVEIACRTSLPMPHLIPDGWVSACDMANTADTRLQGLLYGRYDPEADRIHYDPERIAGTQRRTVAALPDGCQRCPLLRHCAGGCVGAAYWNSGSLYGIDPAFCHIVRTLAARFPEKLGAGYDPSLPLHP
ncbi:MAG: hypothetical protein ABIO70_12170 [Pseudomonadota bacterium]